ncbi:unnamed protein product [Cochlearia groenlandica]
MTVTIITTPHNAARFKTVLNRDIECGLSINLVHVDFPHQEARFLEGQENVDLLESMGFIPTFNKAVNKLEKPVIKLMEEMIPRPSCIIFDTGLYYTSKIAKKFNIPKIVFHVISCFCLMCMHVLLKNREILEGLKSDKESFLLPCFPHKVEFTRLQLPSHVGTTVDGEWKDVNDNLVEAEAHHMVRSSSHFKSSNLLMSSTTRRLS